MEFQMQSIGLVNALRPHAEDDFWGGEESCITLSDQFEPDALLGLSEFSHIEVFFLFHEVDPEKIVFGARHPRNNPDWPQVGIFAQRGKNRPNRLGSTMCRLIRVAGKQIVVAELDAIDGTPIIDIKPVMVEFLPREEIVQPKWSHEIMDKYWLEKK